MRTTFSGFAGDCLITGQLDVQGDRLTDHINTLSTLTLEDVVLEGLDGGRVRADTFTIDRSQVCAALASGPRGARARRIPTDERRIQAQIGPYAILGRYHGRVGATTLVSFFDREPMVPLTDATIAYVVDGILEVRDAPVLIINRDLAAWYRDPDEVEPDRRSGRVPDDASRSRHRSARRGVRVALAGLRR